MALSGISLVQYSNSKGPLSIRAANVANSFGLKTLTEIKLTLSSAIRVWPRLNLNRSLFEVPLGHSISTNLFVYGLLTTFVHPCRASSGDNTIVTAPLWLTVTPYDSPRSWFSCAMLNDVSLSCSFTLIDFNKMRIFLLNWKEYRKLDHCLNLLFHCHESRC